MAVHPGKVKKLKFSHASGFKKIALWSSAFAIVGLATLLISHAATPGITVTVDTTISNPTNLKTYSDDRTATIAWTPVPDAASKGIIGYYVTWGTGGTYSNAKQTEYNAVQLQPLTNGTSYNIKVQSVKGSSVTVSTPGAHQGDSTTENRANGKVSSGITGTATASSALVDQEKQQMTGFFDDFNTAAGAFDELKWNSAGSSCVFPGVFGSFINNQFHAHSQGRSADSNPYTYCDRGQLVNRPRAIFDTTGRTEANPGVIVGDFDGVSHGRDDWYIDIVPLSARKSNVPLDLNTHDSIFQDDTNDPSLIRMVQSAGGLKLMSYGANKAPQPIEMIYTACPDFAGNQSFELNWCGAQLGAQRTDISPLPMLPINFDTGGVIPNVRRHYRIEMSDTKIKVFVDGYKLLEGKMPANFASTKQWVIQNNTFTYNTGKDDNSNPTTAILHWDNFGFNGPAPTTVVHNYIDGSATGTVPYIARGTVANEVPGGNRNTKINIPDPIGTPTKARIMFTFGAFGYQTYTWNSQDNVVINGKKYSYPNPQTNSVQAPTLGDNTADGFRPFADSIAISAADLKQGMNDVQLNLVNTTGAAIFNVHVELEYPKGTEPTYTQPTAIFGASTIQPFIQPTMASHDSYMFIEQDFGLPSGVIDGSTPVNPPPTGDTTPPTVNLTAPTDNTSVSAGASVTAKADANDNVGVDRVEFYLGNTLKATVKTPPYTTSVSTAGLSPSTYTIKAIAYDAAGGNATSSHTIVIPTPADTTAPVATLTNPVNGTTIKGAINVTGSATDNVKVTKTELYIDGAMKATANADTVSLALNTSTLSNGSHTFAAWGYDAAGLVGKSAIATVNVANTGPVDTKAPTNVAITVPSNNATVKDTTTVTSIATDDVGIAKVEFYISKVGASGMNLINTATGAAPYTFQLDTTKYPNGDYSLASKAYDAVPNSTTSGLVTIHINNPAPADTVPPVISLSPAYTPATTVAGSVSLTATASDNVGVTKVEFYVDGAVKNTLGTQASYVYLLDTTSLTNNVHTFVAKAYDAAGHVTTSNTTSVTVNNAAPAKNGDFNNTGVVDYRDLLILLSQYNKPSGTSIYDLSGDKIVNFRDLLILLSLYGK